jgi:hypothetical protein
MWAKSTRASSFPEASFSGAASHSWFQAVEEHAGSISLSLLSDFLLLWFIHAESMRCLGKKE